MRKLAAVFGLMAVATATSVASADHHVLAPTPEGGELFKCVKVEDCDHKAPCAESKIIEIVDPCWKADPCNPCCKPKCVLVEICVPKKQCCDPCSCCKDHGPKITCSKDGKYKKYDYGRYRIEITSRNGVVTVDYDN